MVDELLKFVEQNKLTDVFNYNAPKGYLPYEIELRKLPSGKFFLQINGNGDFGNEVSETGLTEQEACRICYEWLNFHLSIRNSRAYAEETIEKLGHNR